jgi:tetratricopeptide (TPR) repeat protein
MKTRSLGLTMAVALLTAGVGGADIPVSESTPAARAAGLAQRADALAARRSWGEARDAYLEALRSTASLHNKLGICYQHLGEQGQARAEYERAVELRPDYAEAWNNLGTLDHAMRAYDRAVVAYDKAIALQPGNPVFYKNLGLAWLAQDRVEEALTAWSRALGLDPAILTAADPESIPAGESNLGRQYYLYAKLVAARGDVATALELLGTARDHGFRDFGAAAQDPDFASVVEDPRWASLTR